MSRLHDKLEERVNSGLDGLSGNGVTTIFTKPFQNQWVNLVVLGRLLGLDIGKVAYITLRRSHRNIKDLMRKRDLDLEKVVFIDAVHEISGLEPDVKVGGRNIKLVDCPFSEKFKKDLLRQLRLSAKRGKVRLLVIDDLQALCCYMNDDKFLRFTRKLLQTIEKLELDKTIIIVDSKLVPELRATIEMASNDFLEIY
jgi:hypothetical protein